MIHKVIKSDGRAYFIHASLWGVCSVNTPIIVLRMLRETFSMRLLAGGGYTTLRLMIKGGIIMLIKSRSHEVWFNVKNGKSVGLLARVPELLRLDLITTGPDFTLEDLNKWLYLEKSGDYTEYSTREEAEADLV